METNIVYLVSTTTESFHNTSGAYTNLAAVLDLNGDGKLEVIVHSFYYERGQTTIYRCEPDKIEAVLSVEYGA